MKMKSNNIRHTLLKVAKIALFAHIALCGTVLCGWLFAAYVIDLKDELLTAGEKIAIPIGLLALFLSFSGPLIAAISQIHNAETSKEQTL